MYLPLTQDVMINTRCIDQLSFETDQFFLADGKGNYIGAKSGHAIHMWRYDPASKRLFISQSVLFLREQCVDSRCQLTTKKPSRLGDRDKDNDRYKVDGMQDSAVLVRRALLKRRQHVVCKLNAAVRVTAL
ncbi:hypothetical protein HPB48_021384 [Haemaphysalis longicornis]|uniref:Uncharacterized protein n=1 Tax=Haemaphysalis longicornis TaxID=44386 RepID=A0A9J6FXE1_HAELO|nr:hypothetical protein HPB48_021384 [Haemaphysalis longicornis]